MKKSTQNEMTLEDFNKEIRERSLCNTCKKIEKCEKHNLPNFICWYRKCDDYEKEVKE